jgi:hypothetical protein
VVPEHYVAVSSSVLLKNARTLVLGLVSALAGFALTASPGCGTDAKGVDECRDIERARCQAAASCGIVNDAEACERFYRDHCLHGMATTPPSSAEVAACVRTIQVAGSCASENGIDALLMTCPTPENEADVLRAPRASRACEIVATPELADNCAFLTPIPPSGEGGAGGETG